MKTVSVRWLAPQKNRRLLVVFCALTVLSFLLLYVIPFHAQGLLARSALVVFFLALLVALPLSLFVLFLQVVPWRRGTLLFKSYLTFVCLLVAIWIVLIFIEIPEVVRTLLGCLLWTTLLLPKAIVLWTVPDVSGSWDFGVIPERPPVSPLLCGRRRGMPSNVAIDDKLLEEALHLGGHRTKKATVNEALKEYVQRRKQLKILDLFGQIDYDPDYDYKEQRRE
jgi:hypothetical protein